jgi:hypothetical protein
MTRHFRVRPTRRPTATFGLGALALAMLIGGCSGDENRPRAEGAATSKATEYVGTVTGVDPESPPTRGAYFVAVAIDDAGRVKAYMCDGTGNRQAFVGRVENDELDFESETGEARLAARVADSEIEGEVELRGQWLGFRASAARAIGGLYTLATTDGLSVSGKSERGNTVSVEATSEDRGDVAGTVTTPAGEQRPLEFGLTSDPSAAYDEFRVVILDSGRFRGNRTVGAHSIATAGARFANVPAG